MLGCKKVNVCGLIVQLFLLKEMECNFPWEGCLHLLAGSVHHH